MTFSIVSPGLVVDGQAIVGQVDVTVGGGQAEYDEQKLQGALQPTSEVQFEFDGYRRRTLEISIYLATKVPHGALEKYAALALLNQAYRGGGNTPLTHTVTGPLAESQGFDVPWFISAQPAVRDGLTTEVTLHLVELDPEAVSAGTAQVMPDAASPPAEQPVPDAEDALTQDMVSLMFGYEQG